MRLTHASTFVALTILCLACAGERTPERTPPPSVFVEQSGFSVRNDRIGVAALIRVRGHSRFATIALEISFRDGDDVIATERSDLPFCLPARDCWWGETFIGPSIDGRWESIDNVRVRTIGKPRTTQRAVRIRELDVERNDEAAIVTVEPPDAEGVMYLVAFAGRVPRFGHFTFVTGAEPAPRTFRESDFLSREGERIRAFFYASAVPASVRGPTD